MGGTSRSLARCAEAGGAHHFGDVQLEHAVVHLGLDLVQVSAVGEADAALHKLAGALHPAQKWHDAAVSSIIMQRTGDPMSIPMA